MNKNLINELKEEVKNIVKDKIINLKLKIKTFFSPLITILDNFLEHKLRYSLFFSLLILVVVPLIYLIYLNRNVSFFSIINVLENNTIVDQLILIKGISLENIYTFLGIIVIIITAIWAMFQFDKSKKEKQQEKASEISYKFSDNIVKKLCIICCVLQEEDFIKNNVLTLNPFEIKDFDFDELSQKVKNPYELIDQYKNLISDEKINQKYTSIYKEILSIDEQSKMPPQFQILISDTLNELESICMDISSTIAGSQFIYPSLHQMFLDTIHILYLHICSNNPSEKVMVDKYYTNLIYVFNEWNKIRKKDIQKKERVKNKIEKINNQKDKQITKAKRNKPKRV